MSGHIKQNAQQKKSFHVATNLNTMNTKTRTRHHIVSVTTLVVSQETGGRFVSYVWVFV